MFRGDTPSRARPRVQPSRSLPARAGRCSAQPEQSGGPAARAEVRARGIAIDHVNLAALIVFGRNQRVHELVDGLHVDGAAVGGDARERPRGTRLQVDAPGSPVCPDQREGVALGVELDALVVEDGDDAMAAALISQRRCVATLGDGGPRDRPARVDLFDSRPAALFMYTFSRVNQMAFQNCADARPLAAKLSLAPSSSMSRRSSGDHERHWISISEHCRSAS